MMGVCMCVLTGNLRILVKSRFKIYFSDRIVRICQKISKDMSFRLKINWKTFSRSNKISFWFSTFSFLTFFPIDSVLKIDIFIMLQNFEILYV